MNRTYQIVDIPGGSADTIKLSDRCRSDFKRVAGIFFASGDDVSEVKHTCRLTINSKEVLPKGTDVNLFLATPYNSRQEVMLDLDNETIEAENSPIEIELQYNNSIHSALKLYLLLTND